MSGGYHRRLRNSKFLSLFFRVLADSSNPLDSILSNPWQKFNSTNFTFYFVCMISSAHPNYYRYISLILAFIFRTLFNSHVRSWYFATILFYYFCPFSTHDQLRWYLLCLQRSDLFFMLRWNGCFRSELLLLLFKSEWYLIIITW